MRQDKTSKMCDYGRYQQEGNTTSRMEIEKVNVMRTEKLLVWMSLRAVTVDGVC